MYECLWRRQGRASLCLDSHRCATWRLEVGSMSMTWMLSQSTFSSTTVSLEPPRMGKQQRTRVAR